MAKDARRESFEQLYSRLEERVARLEQGGLSLEDAIAVYEEGMTLARRCQERLDEAEQKITKLRESFAVLPQRSDSAVLNDLPEDYEYVAGDDEPPEEDRDAE
jgi:exodeoxyribonuclease VII small subunit